MTQLLMIPIVIFAVYLLVRHVKRQFSGEHDCCGCSSGRVCPRRMPREEQ